MKNFDSEFNIVAIETREPTIQITPLMDVKEGHAVHIKLTATQALRIASILIKSVMVAKET